MRTIPLRDARWTCGDEIAPPMAIVPGASTSSRSRSARAPMTDRIASRSRPPMVRSTIRPSLVHVNATSGWVRARSAATRTAALASVPTERRNRNRAGEAANSSQTSTRVPGPLAAAARERTSPLRTWRVAPATAPRVHVVSRSSDTAAMLASASPRKPSVPTPAMSPATAIFEVAWRSTASSRSSSAMPDPSSTTAMRTSPPPSMAISTRPAPASSAFSTSSLTTDAGRSMTSPAAMASATTCGNLRIGAVAITSTRGPGARRAC